MGEIVDQQQVGKQPQSALHWKRVGVVVVVAAVLLALGAASYLLCVYILPLRRPTVPLAGRVVSQDKPASRSLTAVSSSAPDPTIHWQVYSDDVYSFRYPNDWLVAAVQNGSPSLRTADFQAAASHGNGMEVSRGALIQFFGVAEVYDPSGTAALGNYKPGDYVNGGDTHVADVVTRAVRTSVDKYPAEIYDFRGTVDSSYVGTKVDIQKGAKVYSLMMLYASASRREQLDKILSTFHFAR
mgnify:CR=1 FL=1